MIWCVYNVTCKLDYLFVNYYWFVVIQQGSNKKYFKRGELLAKETSTSQSSANKNTENEEEKIESQDSMTKTSDHQLSRPEVIRRLRERGEPILLFGETDLKAFQRLRKREILEPEVNKVSKKKK